MKDILSQILINKTAEAGYLNLQDLREGKRLLSDIVLIKEKDIPAEKLIRAKNIVKQSKLQKRKAKIIKIEEDYYISFKFSIKMLLGYIKMTKRAYVKL
jgi:hypothetical protein